VPQNADLLTLRWGAPIRRVGGVLKALVITPEDMLIQTADDASYPGREFGMDASGMELAGAFTDTGSPYLDIRTESTRVCPLLVVPFCVLATGR
jgi:hypothetical protein